MAAKALQDSEGYRSLRFRWIPVAANGASVGFPMNIGSPPMFSFYLIWNDQA